MGFFSAVGFLTLIPVPHRWRGQLKSSPLYFPLVGALLGVVIWGVYEIVARWTGEASAVVSAIVLLAILTRGLHLDGLADTFDALGSGKTGKEALAVMRDPQIGPFGAVAILCVLFLKGALIYDLPHTAIWRYLILFPAMGRMGVLIPLCFFPYARKEGIVQVFLPSGVWIFFGGLIFALPIAWVLCGVPGLAVLGSILLFCLVFPLVLKKRIGGITGDILGATIELGEVIALFGIHLWVT